MSMKIAKKIISIYLMTVLFIPTSHGFSAASSVTEDEQCLKLLEQAEESYYDGDLDSAIALIQQCLRQPDISETLQIKANALLARTYLSQDDDAAAELALSTILDINPLYEPTLEEATPRYIALVAKVKRRRAQQALAMKQSEPGMSKWIWIGAGGAAAAVVAVLVFSGSGSESSDNNTSLPTPPPLP